MNAASRALAQTIYGHDGLFGVFFNRRMLLVAALGFSVFVSGLAVVYGKDLNRRLYVDLQTQTFQHNELQTEWGQLLLEQSTWTMQGRVENIAQSQLGMSMPQAKNTELVRIN
tara:strand:+ start:20099 stop:20437 length:339 start_codon:yes stop_codon:yes gene_type:complete